MKNAGLASMACKVDITSAFKVMPIHLDSWYLFGVHWQQKYYFAVRLTFECKSSSKIFGMLSKAICWIFSNNYAIPYLIHLISSRLPIPSQQRIFLTVAQNETRGPAMSVEFLGINLDTVKFQVSLSKEKIYRIILVTSTLLDSPNCSERKLPSLLA